MELIITKRDKKLLKAVENIIFKWRKILHIDPLWKIEVIFSESISGSYSAIAALDTSGAAYYMADIHISEALFENPDDFVFDKINEAICHELVHLVYIDFYRTAQLAAGENEEMIAELNYKYEQSTSRLQRALVDLEKQKQQIKKQEEKPRETT